MRTLSGLFVGIFVLSAAVQWNDPDPLVWILGYLAAAGLSLAACFDRLPVVPNAAAALVFACWFLSLAETIPRAPSAAFTSFEMRDSTHEEPREAVGLLICAGWTASLAFRGVRQRRAGAS